MYLICRKVHDRAGGERDGFTAVAEVKLTAQRLYGDGMCGLMVGQGLSRCKAKENEVGTIGALDALYVRARAVRIGIWRDVQQV